MDKSIKLLVVHFTADEFKSLKRKKYLFSERLGYHEWGPSRGLCWHDFLLMLSGVIPKTPFSNLVADSIVFEYSFRKSLKRIPV